MTDESINKLTLLIGRMDAARQYAQAHGIPDSWPTLIVHRADRMATALETPHVRTYKVIFLAGWTELAGKDAIVEGVARLKTGRGNKVRIVHATGAV